MKKTFLVLSLVLGLAIGATAQNGSGLFHRGAPVEEESTRDGDTPGLPGQHGLGGDQDAGTPLGGGVLLLMGLGAAYAMSKKNKD